MVEIRFNLDALDAFIKEAKTFHSNYCLDELMFEKTSKLISILSNHTVNERSNVTEDAKDMLCSLMQINLAVRMHNIYQHYILVTDKKLPHLDPFGTSNANSITAFDMKLDSSLTKFTFSDDSGIFPTDNDSIKKLKDVFDSGEFPVSIMETMGQVFENKDLVSRIMDNLSKGGKNESNI
jgi:hypothetical protein